MAAREKTLARSSKAYFNYTVIETFECGIVLEGQEVKSVKSGKISFSDAFAYVENGEVYVQNFHISPYAFASAFKTDPDRKKKLLLHKDEIARLSRKTSEKGFTLVPLEIYLKHGIVKVRLGLCKGKKTYDKRETIRSRDVKRDIEREFKNDLHGKLGGF